MNTCDEEGVRACATDATWRRGAAGCAVAPPREACCAVCGGRQPGARLGAAGRKGAGDREKDALLALEHVAKAQLRGVGGAEATDASGGPRRRHDVAARAHAPRSPCRNSACPRTALRPAACRPAARRDAEAACQHASAASSSCVRACERVSSSGARASQQRGARDTAAHVASASVPRAQPLRARRRANARRERTPRAARPARLGHRRARHRAARHGRGDARATSSERRREVLHAQAAAAGEHSYAGAEEQSTCAVMTWQAFA